MTESKAYSPLQRFGLYSVFIFAVAWLLWSMIDYFLVLSQGTDFLRRHRDEVLERLLGSKAIYYAEEER